MRAGARRWSIAFMLGLATALAGLSTAQAQCVTPRNLPPISFNIRVQEPQVIFHHDVDLFGLPQLENFSERPPPGWTLLGLTKFSNPFGGLQLRSAEIALPDGRVCVWVVAIYGQLGDPIMNVYVASEFAPGSCEYNVVHDHEYTHVRFNVETLRDWLPSIQAALTEAARRKFPVIYPKAPAGTELWDYLQDNMVSVIELMNEDLRKRNATIDTPENYRRESAKCSNWPRRHS
jgi:hypothetical protein